jgi:membrane protease YdiL (CAAX protease family)
VPAFGEDFYAAKRGWLYPMGNGQSLLLAIALFAGLIVSIVASQSLAGLTGYMYLGVGQGDGARTGDNLPIAVIQGTLVLMLPFSIPVIVLAFVFARIGGHNALDVLALRWPRLGWGGWTSVLVSFVFVFVLLSAITVAVLGIDPADLSSTSEKTGAVERAMSSLASNKLLFALAAPTVGIVIPIVEELVFRGGIFAALKQSKLGSVGAVGLTSLAWALMHAQAAPWLFVGLLFAMGLMLGYLLLRYGSLWVPIACHCLWNSFQALMILNQASAA